jgi:L-asparagine transporter-like permease
MNLLTYIMIGFLIWSAFTTQRSVQQSRTPQERAFVIRATAICWLVGFLFVLALIFLPNKGRVVMMLPAFFIAVALGKAWRNTRERLRREEQQRVDFERMKRVN